jgi:hypothetical protein
MFLTSRIDCNEKAVRSDVHFMYYSWKLLRKVNRFLLMESQKKAIFFVTLKFLIIMYSCLFFSHLCFTLVMYSDNMSSSHLFPYSNLLHTLNVDSQWWYKYINSLYATQDPPFWLHLTCSTLLYLSIRGKV